MATVSTVQLPQQPTVWQKVKLGAMMGTGVGLAIGFIGGSFQILRAGPGPKGALRTLAQIMGTSAATFGFFMSIGTVIRTEGYDAEEEALWRRASSIPSNMQMSRQHFLQEDRQHRHKGNAPNLMRPTSDA